MLKLYYELIKNLNVGTHAAHRTRGGETNAQSHTHTHFSSSSSSSALCSLINKKRNTLRTMLNVIKIQKERKVFIFIAQCSMSWKYLTDTTSVTPQLAACCIVLSTLHNVSLRFLPFSFSLLFTLVFAAAASQPKGVKIYVIRYKCI